MLTFLARFLFVWPTTIIIYLLLWLCCPYVGPWPLLEFVILYIVGRLPWTGDQHVARLYAYIQDNTKRIDAIHI
jgi:hypothetical protein